MKIRLATKNDLNKMRDVFDYGRAVQVASGNPNQWAPGYPTKELMLEDIAKDAAYLCLDDQDEILAVFSMFTEADPTYEEIEGAWLNDEPYTTIHRIASSGQKRGVGQYCIEWVQNRSENVRIDTHKNNQQMKHLLLKLGFEHCGQIYLLNGDSREAYHYEK